MGRKGDGPKTKASKAGRFRTPDKRTRRRRSSARKRSAHAYLSTEDRASLLSAVTDGSVQAPPEFMLGDKAFEAELTIWRELAPSIHELNALQKPDRFTFAMYCVHMADWIEAVLEIKQNGATYTSRNTINGDELQKLNPWVKVREIASRHILEIGARFGLDPANRFKLLRDEALVAGQGNLFDPPGSRPPPAASEDDGDIAGFASRNGASPPRPN